MSSLKDQDPDYGPAELSNEKHRRTYEENARTSTARKITGIVEKEFSHEINSKETEILEIQDRLHTALKTLHLLRYVIVADFYNKKQCQVTQGTDVKQIQIHPAIKKLIGKTPRDYNTFLASTSLDTKQSLESPPLGLDDGSFDKLVNIENSMDCRELDHSDKSIECGKLRHSEALKNSGKRVNLEKHTFNDEEPRPRKVPRYVSPKSKETQNPIRALRHKVRKRIIVGNISKWIPLDWREDAASHKWTMYVRGNKENPEIDDFVEKVRFFLHPSYRPNDVVEVTSTPYYLSRRGWGEFPVRVQLHFKSTLDKPMDIIHHLKLDRTYTGLQTLGSETLVDIWIYSDANKLPRKLVMENKSEAMGKDLVEKPLMKTAPVKALPESKSVPPRPSVIQKDLQERPRFYVDLDHDYFGSRAPNAQRTTETNKKQHLKEIPPNLKSLSIFIPQHFEHCASKRVLVLQDDRTIPVDIASSSADLKPSKVNSAINRGISLLKKPSNPDAPTLRIKSSASLLLNPRNTVPALQLAQTRAPPLDQGVIYPRIIPSGSFLLNPNNKISTIQFVAPKGSIIPNNIESLHQETWSSRLEGPVKPRIALGKDKHRTLSRRNVYEEVLKVISEIRITGTNGLLRFIISRLPMVTGVAVDPDYKRIHPYASKSEEEFFAHTIGKRRALEWHRAKMARFHLKSNQCFKETWSIKEILVWARLHGYTPSNESIVSRSTTRNRGTKNLPSSRVNTSTEPIGFLSWVRSCPDGSMDSNADDYDDFKEIDVVGLEHGNLKVLQPGLEGEYPENAIVVELDKKLLPFHDFVVETARGIGVKLLSQEIVPGVVHCTPARLIMKAVECFLDEVVRSSLAKAWERHDDIGCPKLVALDDVRQAILNREEFDVLTNEGLGSRPAMK